MLQVMRKTQHATSALVVGVHKLSILCDWNLGHVKENGVHKRKGNLHD
jgi:hypothetical protein